MKLLSITKALPERDETFKIVDWKYEVILANPQNIQFISWVDEIQRCVVTLTNGSAVPVKETMSQLAERFEMCTK